METSKIPGPQVGFTDLVDHCLTSEENFLETFPLRPSSAGKCSRAMAMELWQYLGKGKFPSEQREPHVKRLLSLGSSVEYHVIRNFDLIAKANRDFKVTYKQQVLLAFRLAAANKQDTNPPVIKGSLDFAVEQLKERWAVFFDCKSAKDKFSMFYGSKWDETTEKLNSLASAKAITETSWWVEDLGAFLSELNDPFFEDNFRQLNIYCCTDFAKEVNCVAGSILRYNKNDSRHIEVRFKPSPALAKEFEAKCNYVYKLAINGSLDEIKALGCEYPPGHIKHAFCPCHTYAGESQEEARQAYFRTFPPKKWADHIDKLKQSDEVADLFDRYEEFTKQGERALKLEQDIIKLLGEEKCGKVKLKNGHVYEVKSFKTGGVGNGPRVALKRTKS